MIRAALIVALCVGSVAVLAGSLLVGAHLSADGSAAGVATPGSHGPLTHFRLLAQESTLDDEHSGEVSLSAVVGEPLRAV